MVANSSELTVYCGQFQPGLDAGANLDQIASAVLNAHASGAHLAIFPEYSHSRTSIYSGIQIYACEKYAYWHHFALTQTTGKF